MQRNATLAIVGTVLIAALAITTVMSFVDDSEFRFSQGTWGTDSIGGYDRSGTYSQMEYDVSKPILDIKNTNGLLFTGTFAGYDIAGTAVSNFVSFKHIGSVTLEFTGIAKKGTVTGAVSIVDGSGTHLYSTVLSKHGTLRGPAVPDITGVMTSKFGEYSPYPDLYYSLVLNQNQKIAVNYQTGSAFCGTMDMLRSTIVEPSPIIGAVISNDSGVITATVLDVNNHTQIMQFIEGSAVTSTGIFVSNISGTEGYTSTMERVYGGTGYSPDSIPDMFDFEGTEWIGTGERCLDVKGLYEERYEKNSLSFSYGQRHSMTFLMMEYQRAGIYNAPVSICTVEGKTHIWFKSPIFDIQFHGILGKNKDTLTMYSSYISAAKEIESGITTYKLVTGLPAGSYQCTKYESTTEGLKIGGSLTIDRIRGNVVMGSCLGTPFVGTYTDGNIEFDIYGINGGDNMVRVFGTYMDGVFLLSMVVSETFNGKVSTTVLRAQYAYDGKEIRDVSIADLSKVDMSVSCHSINTGSGVIVTELPEYNFKVTEVKGNLFKASLGDLTFVGALGVSGENIHAKMADAKGKIYNLILSSDLDEGEILYSGWHDGTICAERYSLGFFATAVLPAYESRTLGHNYAMSNGANGITITEYNTSLGPVSGGMASGTVLVKTYSREYTAAVIGTVDGSNRFSGSFSHIENGVQLIYNLNFIISKASQHTEIYYHGADFSANISAALVSWTLTD